MLRTTRCFRCKHFTIKEDPKDKESVLSFCPAFPDGIPKEIDRGLHSGTELHDKPIDGQVGDFIFEERGILPIIEPIENYLQEK